MTTIWKKVVGYEDRYEVSDDGRIRSVSREIFLFRSGNLVKRPFIGVLLKPSTMSSGHKQVSLSKDGSSKTRLVHSIVLEAFVGPRPGHYLQWHGCHNDGNPSNNKIENLRWDTRCANELDKIAHGRSNRGTRNRASKLSEVQAKEIKVRIANGEKSPDIALLYGVTRGNINAIKRGSAWAWL